MMGPQGVYHSERGVRHPLGVGGGWTWERVIGSGVCTDRETRCEVRSSLLWDRPARRAVTQTSRIALRANLEVLASTGEDVRHGAVALAEAVPETRGGPRYY